MIRRTTMIWVLLSAFAGIWMFVVKHQVESFVGELQRLERAIVDQQQASHVLSAEWSYLNQPGRLDELGRRLMGLAPMTARQQTEFSTLGDALVRPEETRDEAPPDGLRIDAKAEAGR